MKLPFLVRPGLQTEAVGDESIGIIHFLQMGDVAVAEDPPSLQKRNDMTLEMILVLEDVAERISKDLSVPLDYCRAKVYATSKKRDSGAVEAVTVRAVDGAVLELESGAELAINDWIQFDQDIAIISKLIKPKRGSKIKYEIADTGVVLEVGDTGLIKSG